MLEWVGCWMLCIGFVGASSGWTWMLGRWGNDRPAWSVCGQDMCACAPTTVIEPDCPLCEIRETGAEEAGSHSGASGPERGAPILRTLSDADDAACSMMAAIFVFGVGGPGRMMLPEARSPGWMTEQTGPLMGLSIGVPTPPPRRG